MRNAARILLALCLAALTSCGHPQQQEPARAEEAQVAPAPAAFTSPVRVVSEVGGTVREVLVGARDRVRRDQVLVVLDPTPFEERMAESRRALGRAEAGLHAARTNYLKLVQRAELGGGPDDATIGAAKAALEHAAAARDEALAGANRANREFARSVVRSPFDGRLVEMCVVTNGRVSAREPIATVVPDRP
jgi:multidrug resistance efflux pump